MAKAKPGRYRKICPKCSSTNVPYDMSSPAAVALGALYTRKCNNCGFSGNDIIFPEVPAGKEPKTKRGAMNIDDARQVNVAYGNGWKVILAVGAITPLLMLLLSLL